ncbi:glycosyltransferase family 4 protein [Mucilaginibacter paludis]|uniref:Glycosyl transferase group 1 n=1 Tax=Mucilaginibacter paludis DSM 18603 TaxID=714943 RepID=H1Y6G5_9SPHI|nr:glycosyltransferase family 1 protein [Mucilaginibacter paludis]EHQ25809.1 glycosyl transferase group 1 [Mucilaginibacter paludis DSM 18603]
MRIGYEAKRAFLNTTGLGNYSRGVISMMASYYPDNQYFLYTPKIVADKRIDLIKAYPQVTTITPQVKLFTSLWRSRFVVNDLKRDDIQLYHGLSHELPVGIHRSGIKSVITIHDLIFMRYPQYFGYISRKIYKAKIKYACKHADRIIAISERTKEDLVELLNLDPDKIEVIYQDCDKSFKIKQSAQKKAEVSAKYKLPEKFILHVGTIEERKNLWLLVKAFRLLPGDAQLVVIGRPTDYVKKIEQYINEHELAGRILFIQNADFTDLPAIYQLAEIFIYPSRYEGFGIPILEALVSGTPVIAATGSCLEEAGGPDSLYVNPDDEVELSEKIQSLLGNPLHQQTMIAKGLQYTRKFEDKKLSEQLMNVYQNVLNHA